MRAISESGAKLELIVEFLDHVCDLEKNLYDPRIANVITNTDLTAICDSQITAVVDLLKKKRIF